MTFKETCTKLSCLSRLMPIDPRTFLISLGIITALLFSYNACTNKDAKTDHKSAPQTTIQEASLSKVSMNIGTPQTIYVVICNETPTFTKADMTSKGAISLNAMEEILVEGKVITKASVNDYDYVYASTTSRKAVYSFYVPVQYIVPKSPYDEAFLETISDFVIDEDHTLPYNYEPDDLFEVRKSLKADSNRGLKLRREAKEAFESMLDAALKKKQVIKFISTFRAASYQDGLYRSKIKKTNPKQKIVAKPTTSEHQLGTTCDLSSAAAGWDLTTHFDKTSEFAWLDKYAKCFGIYMSYQKDTSKNPMNISYEPWHYRYTAKISSDKGCDGLR